MTLLVTRLGHAPNAVSRHRGAFQFGVRKAKAHIKLARAASVTGWTMAVADSRLIHDMAWATAVSVVEVFNLRDDERVEALREVYERVRTGLLRFVEYSERERHRLYDLPPGEN